MSMFTSPESRARAYLDAVGRDPDEIVTGYACGHRFRRPAWTGMQGAGPETAEGAMELSPKQRALVAKGGRST